MSALFIASVVVVYLAEQHGTPAQHAAGIHTGTIAGSTGGNLEGKEQRFGIANSRCGPRSRRSRRAERSTPPSNR
jgi:K+-transporting ATPase ATPase A chain